MQEIALRIGSLSLHGFSRVEAQRVEDGFRDELARLTTAELGGAEPAARRAVTLPLGVVEPAEIGRQAARALVRGGGK